MFQHEAVRFYRTEKDFDVVALVVFSFSDEEREFPGNNKAAKCRNEFGSFSQCEENDVASIGPFSQNSSYTIYAVSSIYQGQSRRKIGRFPQTELTGYMKLRLWVATNDTDDMDLFVGVKKYDRRGEEVYLPDFDHIEWGQVATGWLRVSHRELDTERSTPAQPWLKHKRVLKLNKGEIVPVDIEILPSGTLFKAGELLVLVVKGSEIIPTPPHAMLRYGQEEYSQELR